MTEEQPQTTEIIAHPARDYRWKRYVLVLFIFGFGLRAIQDGFFRYEKENQEYAKKYGDEKLPHGGFDIPLNKAMGILFPPLSLLFGAWVLYSSRGTYLLSGDTLYLPGHPAIPLNAIRKIDRDKWDRKGIAYVEYQIPGTSQSGRFKLDDFVYQRIPTDRIFEQIEAALASPAAIVTDDSAGKITPSASSAAVPPPPAMHSPQVAFTPQATGKPRTRPPQF